MCDQNEERARAMGEEGLNFFSYALGHHYFFGRHEVGKTDIWSNFKGNKMQMPGVGGETACVGTPDQIRKRLREYEEVGVDQVVFISQAGNNKHEDICASLEPVRQGSAARVQGARATAREEESGAPRADHRECDEAQAGAESAEARWPDHRDRGAAAVTLDQIFGIRFSNEKAGPLIEAGLFSLATGERESSIMCY